MSRFDFRAWVRAAFRERGPRHPVRRPERPRSGPLSAEVLEDRLPTGSVLYDLLGLAGLADRAAVLPGVPLGLPPTTPAQAGGSGHGPTPLPVSDGLAARPAVIVEAGTDEPSARRAVDEPGRSVGNSPVVRPPAVPASPTGLSSGGFDAAPRPAHDGHSRTPADGPGLPVGSPAPVGVNPFAGEAPAATPEPTDGVAGAELPARSGTTRIGFDDGLAGWDIDIRGGTPDGRGSVTHGSAYLREGDSYYVGLDHPFTVPENPAPVTFTFTELAFDRTDPASMKDAFEAAVLTPDGRTLVHAHADDRDSFFNVAEESPTALGPGAAETGGAVKTVTLDVSGVPAGTEALVRFWLVNNDADTTTSVRILTVDVPSDDDGPPVASVAGDAAGVRGQPREFRVSATDPTPSDRAAGFTFGVDFGDGATQTVRPGEPLRLLHAYAETGTYAVSVTATDRHGNVSSPATHAVTVTEAALQTDPCDPTKTVFAVGGTPGDDAIRFERVGTAGQVRVVMNGTTYGPFTPTGRVLAFGQAGGDAVTVGNVALTGWLYGGAGADALTGGSQSDILFGGGDDDTLTGLAGRDIFVGGAGADTTAGGLGDELLIDGTTAFDDDPHAWCAIQAEWTSSRGFLARVKNLRGESTAAFADRLNGGYVLTAGLGATVYTDGSPDHLHGQDNNCWYLADADPGAGRDEYDFGDIDIVEDVDAAGPSAGPVAAFDFDAGAGPTLPDVTGHGHDGAVAGAAWTPAGHTGGALSFDGIDDWVTVTDAAALDLTTGMTLEAWVKPAVLSGWRTVVLKETAGLPNGLSYGLYAHDPDRNRPAAFANTGGSDVSAAGTAKLSANAWSHLAATYDGLTLRLYVNGSEVRSTALTLPLRATDHPLRIGGNAVWGEYFAGLIDDVRVYDRALSAAEVARDRDTPVGPTADGTKFFVADPSAGAAFRYGADGATGGAYSLGVANPVGVASDAAGLTQWVIDGTTYRVSVVGPDGSSRGSWQATGLTAPTDVTTDGRDVWVADAARVVRYADAARLTGGSAAPADAFALHGDNVSPTGVVTDGLRVWVTDDARDEVFVYGTEGALLGRWGLDPANADASAVTRDPTGASADLWVADRADARVYRYAGGTGWWEGSKTAADNFALAAGNTQPEGIADPPTVELTSPTDGRGYPPESEVLLTGRAADDALAAVRVNGRPVDALDPAGNFFTRVTVRPGHNAFTFAATDSFGQTATTTLTLDGTTPTDGDRDFSLFSDVSASFRGEYGRTSWQGSADVLFAELAVRNAGDYPADAPLLVGVQNISDPTVRVHDPAGTTPDGTPYFDFSALVAGGTLAPGGRTAFGTLAFFNPNSVRFTYELVFLGKLNRAPEVTSVPDVEALAGRVYRYDVDAADPDGDAVTFSLASAPPGMAIDPTTGRITWATTLADLGTASVAVRASDGRGGVAEQRYALAVIVPPPNRPPAFTSVPEVSARVGSEYAYAATARDPDDDALTFAVAAGPAGLAIDAATGAVRWVPSSS